MDKKNSKYMGYLIYVLAISFLLVTNIKNVSAMGNHILVTSSINKFPYEGKTEQYKYTTYKKLKQYVTDISKHNQSKDSEGVGKTENESGLFKAILPFQLDLRLAGTVMVGKEYPYALIVEETTGRQNLYSVGEIIKGVKILKIDIENVVVEKDGRTHILSIMDRSYKETASSELPIGDKRPSIGVLEGLTFFGHVLSDTSSPVDVDVPVEKLPYIVPITNNIRPLVDYESLHDDLPEFVPFESYSEPPEE